MNNYQQITLAIITYNRKNELNTLLNSIFLMKKKAASILIIDNDKKKSAKNISKKWQKKLPIRYINETKKGAPHARNRALKETNTKYLSFVDDDCILTKSWLSALNKQITISFKEKSNYAYIMGRSKLQNSNNVWAKIQFRRYEKWFYNQLEPKNLSPFLLDTKNICFDLEKIRKNKIKFDTQFIYSQTAGSEDTDFGLQISNHNLYGIFCKNMILYHKENETFASSLKKTYQKGVLESHLHRKWKMCSIFHKDIYNTNSLPLFLNKLLLQILHSFSKNHSSFFEELFQSFFLLGYWKEKQKTKKVLLIYCADGLANTLRASELKKQLESKLFDVTLLDTKTYVHKYYVNKGRDTFFSWLKYHLRHMRFILFLWPPHFFNQKYPVYSQLIQRSNCISQHPLFSSSDILICQSPYEMFSLSKSKKNQVTILDSPTSLYHEIQFSKKSISQDDLLRIKNAEISIFNSVSYNTFHWHSLKPFIENEHDIIIPNYISTGWGTNPSISKNHTTKYQNNSKSPPKIIFMGNLDDYWTNTQLLFDLIKKSKFKIDLYGKTNNKKILKMKEYKGYLMESDFNLISTYQFGLISITNDPLRNHGFSAKHLFYFSHGLPVLCPKWRKDRWLNSGTISFTQDTFDKKIAYFLKTQHWKKKHDSALKIAENNSWEACFSKLIATIS